MDTTTDGIENTRVAIRKPSTRLFDGGIEALVPNQIMPTRSSVSLTGARGDATIKTRGNKRNAASVVENTFNNSNDLVLAFLDAGGTNGVPAIKEADKGTVRVVVHAKV